MHNTLRTGLLLAAMTALFLAVGYLLAGEGGLMIAFVLALVMNGYSYWNSDKLVLRMHGARPVSREQAPDLYGMVEQLARRTRSCVGGWVRNRLSTPPMCKGLTMNRCAVAGLRSALGLSMPRARRSIFCRARASHIGRPQISAPTATLA
jgi:hypothetical protein